LNRRVQIGRLKWTRIALEIKTLLRKEFKDRILRGIIGECLKSSVRRKREASLHRQLVPTQIFPQNIRLLSII